MPKCQHCGEDYISGELTCPNCFEPVPIAPPVAPLQVNEPRKEETAEDIRIELDESRPSPFDILFSGQGDDPNSQGIWGNFTSTDVSKPKSPQADSRPSPINAPPVVMPNVQVNTGSALKLGSVKLRIKSGPLAGNEILLTSEIMSIGRFDPASRAFVEIDLTDGDPKSMVSRLHARIIFERGVYFIEDLGSTNGTFILRNGKLVGEDRIMAGNREQLHLGDEIVVANIILQFQAI